MQQSNDKPAYAIALALCGAAVLLLLLGAGLGFKLRSSINEVVYEVRTVVDELHTDPLTVTFEGADAAPLDIAAGFKKFRDVEDPGFLLLSRYLPDEKRSVIQLLNLGSGGIEKQWDPDPVAIREFSDFEDFRPVNRFSPQSPLLLEDGGLAVIDNQGLWLGWAPAAR